MAELTIEAIRQVIREEVERSEGRVRSDMRVGRDHLQFEVGEGLEQILDAVQAFSGGLSEDLAGFDGRLRNHNERTARLERLHNAR